MVTRWIADFEPETLKGSLLYGTSQLPIINVARVEDGKIVEFWNHRHDIDTPQTMKFTLKGFGLGLLFGFVPLFIFTRVKKRKESS